MKSSLNMFKNSLILTVAMLVICGVLFPLALTGVSQLVFNKQANGNLVMVNGEAVGSELVGQQFTDERFFRGRVSTVNYNTYTEEDLIPDAEGNTAYGGVSSGNTNYGATNPALHERVEADLKDFLAKHPEVKQEDIPTDLLTASGSGMDPHISPESAKIQIPAVAKATGLTEEALIGIVDSNTEHKILGIFGEEKVNVLKSNIAVAEAMGIL